jgi:hypothetical protein
MLSALSKLPLLPGVASVRGSSDLQAERLLACLLE